MRPTHEITNPKMRDIRDRDALIEKLRRQIEASKPLVDHILRAPNCEDATDYVLDAIGISRNWRDPG